MDSIFHRISVRKYEDKMVEKEKILQILKAGMQAPSACNQQPWEFYVVTDREKIRELSGVSPYSGCAAGAPVVIVPVYRKHGLIAPEYAQNITIFNMPEESSKQNELILELIHEGFEGIFCYPHFVRELLPAFIELKIQGIPLIFWDYSPLPGIFPAVGIDHFQSCMLAAEVLAGQHMPVTYIGFEESEQNRLKYLGFHAGCRQFQLAVEKEILLPYRKAFGDQEEIGFEQELVPGKLYFASTRLLSSRVIGTMFDRGCLPGKDYRILTVDRVKFMEGSSLQLDSMMRDHTQMMHKLLSEMQHAVRSRNNACNDWRNPMRYIPGASLAH